MTAKARRPHPAMAADGRDVDEASRGAAQHARDGIGVPLRDVVAWVESWDSGEELPEPEPRKLY